MLRVKVKVLVVVKVAVVKVVVKEVVKVVVPGWPWETSSSMAPSPSWVSEGCTGGPSRW